MPDADLPFTVCVDVWLLAATGTQPTSARRFAVSGVTSVIAYSANRWYRSPCRVDYSCTWSSRTEGRCSHRYRRAVIAVGSWSAYIHHVERSDEYTHPAYPYQRAQYSLYNVSYATNFALRDPNFPGTGHGDVARMVTADSRQHAEGCAIARGSNHNSEEDWAAAIAAAKSAGPPWSWIPWRIADLTLWTGGVLALAGLLVLAARGTPVYAVLVGLYMAQLSLLPTFTSGLAT